jgi:hypothetical protein
MEQVAGDSEYHVAGDRVEMRRGWPGIEAFDVTGFADME